MGYEIRDYQDSRLFKGECFYCAGFDHDSEDCENNPNNIKENKRERTTEQIRVNS